MSINEERQNFINRFGQEQLSKYSGALLLKLIAAPKQTANNDLKQLFGEDFAPGYSSMYQALEEETKSCGSMNGNMTATREIFYSVKEQSWKHYKQPISPEEAIQEAEQIKKHLLQAANFLEQNQFEKFYTYANENKQFFSKGFIHKYLYICFPEWIILDWHKTGYDADAFYKKELGIQSSELFSLEYYFYQKNPNKNLAGVKEALEKQFGAFNSSKPTLDIKREEKGDIFPLNQILYGPPGTGKTYHTVIKALEIINNRLFTEQEKTKEKYDNKLLPEFNKLKQQGQIQFLTFHQNYSYEDFMVGIRPNLQDGQISYKLYEGPFKQIADRARKDSNNNYVLIIDEINRGNISKIFGELITLIEEDKRAGNKHALSAPLLYQDKEFSVPNNLYIIGTMNTADKSIALVDIALRRRFIFEEMMPNAALLNKVEGFDLPNWFTKLNQKITAELDRDHQIGHSEFMKIETLADLQQKFYQWLLPLLKEYFYGNPNKLKEIIPGFTSEEKLEGEAFKTALECLIK